MAIPTLIYCAGGNPRLAQIAIDAGFRYGARLPASSIEHPLYFADQDWKRPNRAAYMEALRQYRPTMATVLDWERPEQFPEVIDWAEEAAQYAEQVLIVPKVPGILGQIPRRVGGKKVVLAYSVPTRYGGSPVPLWEFAGWPVHLLGGSPHAQMMCWRYLAANADVVSTDGNMANLMATRFCAFWNPHPATAPVSRYARWPPIESIEGSQTDDAPYRAFARSCQNIAAAWQALCG